MALDSVRMGTTGLYVSELFFGTWRFGRETDAGAVETDRETAMALLSAYEAAGGRSIDTADVYGEGRAEQWIGDWLAERDREDFVLASKVYWPVDADEPNYRGLNRKHLRRQVDAICDRLGTDYLDVLYVHRWDDATPAAELMRTLTGFVDDGRVHYLGASTLRPNAWKVARANELARERGWEPFPSPSRGTTWSTARSRASTSSSAASGAWQSFPGARSPRAFSRASTPARATSPRTRRPRTPPAGRTGTSPRRTSTPWTCSARWPPRSTPASRRSPSPGTSTTRE